MSSNSNKNNKNNKNKDNNFKSLDEFTYFWNTISDIVNEITNGDISTDDIKSEFEYSLEEFDNPKEKNRKSYKKRKLYDENIKKQVTKHDGWFRTYELVRLKTGNYPYEKTYVVKWNRNHSGVNKYFKNQSNRAVRRTNRNLDNYEEDCEDFYNNNSYRKIYDYAWTID